jgi:hypothetical protein
MVRSLGLPLRHTFRFYSLSSSTEGDHPATEADPAIQNHNLSLMLSSSVRAEGEETLTSLNLNYLTDCDLDMAKQISASVLSLVSASI